MVEFLNTYSTLIVAVLFGLVAFLEKRNSKIAKMENEKRIKEAKEAEEMREKLLEIQRKEQMEKDENLDTTLKRIDTNLHQLSEKVDDMQSGLDRLSGDFEDFKKDTSDRFTAVGESCFLTTKYSRGVASVTLSMDRNMNNGSYSKEGETLQKLYESQEDYFLEGSMKRFAVD